MEVLQHNNLLLIIVMAIFRIAFCAIDCENGVLRPDFVTKQVPETNCSNVASCYKEIANDVGLCYLPSDRKITHRGEDCLFKIPIISNVEGLLLSDEYVRSSLFTAELEGPPSLANAFKHCHNINCHLVLYNKDDGHVYFIKEPKPIEPSDVTHFGSNVTHFGSNVHPYLFFIEPRCESGLHNVTDICPSNASPLENTMLTVDYEQSTISYGLDHSSCQSECFGNCQKYMYFYEDSSCHIWEVRSLPVQSTENPICVNEIQRGLGIYALDVELSPARDNVTIGTDGLLGITNDELGCWIDCVRHPFCEAIALGYDDKKCYLLSSDSRTTNNSGNSQSILYLANQKIGTDTACNYGTIESEMISYTQPSECEAYGFCFRNLGTSFMPSYLCYMAGNFEDRTVPEPIQMKNGLTLTETIGWENAQRTAEFFSTNFPQIFPTSIWEICLEACSNVTCFGLALDSSDPTTGCRLALEPFTLTSETDDDVVSRRVAFVKHEMPIVPTEEVCQDEDQLQPNTHFGSAVYMPHIEEEVQSLEDCMEKCEEVEFECRRTVLFQKEGFKCLIFESVAIFASDVGTSMTLPSGRQSGQKCTLEPNDGGRFRPTTISHHYSFSQEQFISAEPVETVAFGKSNLDFVKNWCWEYCSHLPWCQTIHLYSNQCLLFDRDTNTLVPSSNGHRLEVMSAKQFTDKHFCDNGGFMEYGFSLNLNAERDMCEFSQDCFQEIQMGTETIPVCYKGRHTQSEPIQVNSHCSVRPFFTPVPGLTHRWENLEYISYEISPDVDTYEDCVRLCSWDTACLGFFFIPSMNNTCGKVGYDWATQPTFRSKEIQARDPMIGRVEFQGGLLVQHCAQCVRRVLMQEQIVYKDELQCSHTYTESCSDVYQTVFKTQEVEECKESFEKNCHIEYETVPRSEKVEVCHSPLTRDCNEEGPAACTTEYETVCATTYHENEVTDDVVNCSTVKEEVCDSNGDNCRMVPRQVCQVDTVSSKKLTPEMDCRQEAREVCGPEICPIVKGDRICADELKTFVQEVPQEKCQITPKTVCDKVHKIVPKLEMSQECIEVPQENCQRVQVEAAKEKIPIVKEWCPPSNTSSTGDNDASSQSNGTRAADVAFSNVLQDTSLMEELAITER